MQVDRPRFLRVRSTAEIKIWASLAHRENLDINVITLVD